MQRIGGVASGQRFARSAATNFRNSRTEGAFDESASGSGRSHTTMGITDVDAIEEDLSIADRGGRASGAGEDVERLAVLTRKVEAMAQQQAQILDALTRLEQRDPNMQVQDDKSGQAPVASFRLP